MQRRSARAADHRPRSSTAPASNIPPPPAATTDRGPIIPAGLRSTRPPARGRGRVGGLMWFGSDATLGHRVPVRLVEDELAEVPQLIRVWRARRAVVVEL